MANVHPGAANAASAPPAPADAPWGICALCHRPLIRPGSVGGCPRCIVRFVDLDDDDSLFFASSGAEEISGYAHFEIARREDGSLDELGHGAMGTTFRAVDTVLRTPVALKVIGCHVADTPAVRARFLREARAAAQLRHPNVASVSHYGEQDGECFYAMELVEGETLEECVRRDGPLPVRTVLEIGLQVAHALMAAEAQRLVHRDIKPGNLMWVASPCAGKPNGPPLIKVIDFGLAKALTGDPDAPGESDTRHSFSGTPAFASPEQFARAEDLPVDTRSDLYSLGVTLWYLLCARTPFRGETLEEIHRQQTRQPLPVDQLVARRVPPPVVALLRSVLAVDPRQRPQSGREFIERLERCLDGLPSARGMRARRLRGIGWGLLAAGALAALFVVSKKGGDRSPRPPAAMVDRSLAVLPFENLSPDPAEAFLATATQDAVTEKLSRLKEIKVIGADSTRLYQPGQRDLPGIGRELGVRFLLGGSVRRENGQVQITTQLFDARDGTRLWEKQYRNTSADLFSVYRDITLGVASRLQAVLSPDEQAALGRPPTTDPAAYDLYLRVDGDFHCFTGEEDHRELMRRYVAQLEEAVARDPRFLLAHCELAVIYMELAYQQTDVPTEQRTVDYRRLAQTALQRAEDLDPDAGELRLAHAEYFLKIEHDVERARIECERARRTLPNSARVEFIAGRIARRQGRWEDAIRSMERAATLEPRNLDVLQMLQESYLELRSYGDVDRTMLRILAVLPERERGEASLDTTLSALEGNANLEPLRRARAARATDGSLSDLAKEYADLQIAVFGHDAEALLRVVAASGKDQTAIMGLHFPNAFFEGLAARMRGDAAAAQAAFARARPLAEKAALNEPTDGRPLSLLALIDAGAGRREDAVREGRRACELTMPYEKYAMEAPGTHGNLAAVYAWTGQPDLAFAELDAIVDRSAGGAFLMNLPTYGDFQLDPIWDPLRGDPRFAALVEKLAPKPTR